VVAPDADGDGIAETLAETAAEIVATADADGDGELDSAGEELGDGVPAAVGVNDCVTAGEREGVTVPTTDFEGVPVSAGEGESVGVSVREAVVVPEAEVDGEADFDGLDDLLFTESPSSPSLTRPEMRSSPRSRPMSPSTASPRRSTRKAPRPTEARVPSRPPADLQPVEHRPLGLCWTTELFQLPSVPFAMVLTMPEVPLYERTAPLHWSEMCSSPSA
jgi:hypothetical protein